MVCRYWGSFPSFCNQRKQADRHVVDITGFEDVPADDEHALAQAVSQQPVSVAICANRALQLYHRGVFNGASWSSSVLLSICWVLLVLFFVAGSQFIHTHIIFWVMGMKHAITFQRISRAQTCHRILEQAAMCSGASAVLFGNRAPVWSVLQAAASRQL